MSNFNKLTHWRRIERNVGYGVVAHSLLNESSSNQVHETRLRNVTAEAKI